MKRIEVQCERCLERNQKAERLITSLQEDLKLSEDRYEAFKEITRTLFSKRRGFWAFIKGTRCTPATETGE